MSCSGAAIHVSVIVMNHEDDEDEHGSDDDDDFHAMFIRIK